MSNQYTISDIGLRLIKAYEGYASNGNTMRGGRKLVGYGRVTKDMELKLSESEAETLLLNDLATVENIVNTNVHAAMSQSQFDALCSLAYSIGVEAFLNSDVLHALNRGEIITAANAFDGWRLGNIDGQIYVVDALVRRRTAEKALFLRPGKIVPAPHEALQAFRDDRQLPERVAQTRTRETKSDRPSNIVPLYERKDDPVTDTQADSDIVELSEPLELLENSPIAEAAAEVSDRLDALMENTDEPADRSDEEDWPTSLIDERNDDTDLSDFSNEVPGNFEQAEPVEIASLDADLPIEGADGDQAGRYASADKYIESPISSHKRQNFWAYVTMTILGLTLGGAGALGRMRDDQFFGEFSRLAWSAVFAIGVLMLIMGLYYLVKQLFSET